MTGVNLRSFIENEIEINSELLQENYSEDETLNELEANELEPFPIRKVTIKFYK
jgi:hypothetical protein